ncbi:DegQ family serine endoprotease [Pedosphaera parvula]|uniref:Protease Do n=1 Tax=Pedosphaera parvula (strain Ellin514) TaxID=320771 RepID=B9XB48_PEDPL|nr:DegQ family serine endoprotease [Pedosphaera parvula]EEF62733.1 protease Do [Pedosphaera parvula Ellin514]
MKRSFLKLCSNLRVSLLAGALVVAGSSLAVNHLVMANDAPKVTTVALNVNDTPVQRDGRFGTSFAPVVKKVAPSVVKVEVTSKSKNMDLPNSPYPDEDFLRRFFGDQFNPRGGAGPNRGGRTMRSPKQYGLGSGVIVNKDGYILTNNHVVEDADEIKVSLNDGREFTAKVIGRDPKTDIAVIKIDAKDLPPITIADSDKIEVGDISLAIGNPFGIGQSVTMGIISATGRGNVGVDYEDFLQTDAAINPGNSGGALVDADGRLIGINTAILSRSGGYQGVGFAVPINLARNVMESLIKNGRVVRGFLGVSIQDLNPSLSKTFKLPDEKGALVGDVSPDSPALKAGIKSGDVILTFNNKPVSDSRHLKLQVAQTTPGSSVPVKVLREGKEQTLKVLLKELPGSEKTERADNGNSNDNDALHGVAVADLDNQARNQLGVPKNLEGAAVSDVDQDSAAYEAGLRPGDIIQEINRQPVHNADEAVKLTENLKDKAILLKVWSKRGEASGSRYVVVDESKSGK